MKRIFQGLMAAGRGGDQEIVHLEDGGHGGKRLILVVDQKCM